MKIKKKEFTQLLCDSEVRKHLTPLSLRETENHSATEIIISCVTLSESVG